MGLMVVLGVDKSSHLSCAEVHKSHKHIDAWRPANLVVLENALVLHVQCVQFPHAGEAASASASCLLVGSLEWDI